MQRVAEQTETQERNAQAVETGTCGSKPLGDGSGSKISPTVREEQV